MRRRGLSFFDCFNATSSHPNILLECFVQIWQLNENWPTGGWGAIEYGTKAQGQVTGGRWKPLVSLYVRFGLLSLYIAAHIVVRNCQMHMMESFLFRDVIAACGQEDQCYVRNDAMHSVNVTVTLEAWSLPARRENDAANYNFFLEGGSIGTLSVSRERCLNNY